MEIGGEDGDKRDGRDNNEKDDGDLGSNDGCGN